MTCLAISAFAPSIFSKAIFAPRRGKKSADAEAAPVSIMNAGVAAVQIGKIGEGICAIANDGKKAVSTATATVGSAQNLATTSNSIFNDAKKAVQFGLKHANVNGMIGGIALLNALYDDDKTRALIQNGGMFGGMLLSEGAHKLAFGSSDSSRENGVNNIKINEGLLYKNSEKYRNAVESITTFCEKQEEALKDCGEVKKVIGKMFKYVPGAAKGISFAGASICGSALFYWLSGKVADAVLGEEQA